MACSPALYWYYATASYKTISVLYPYYGEIMPRGKPSKRTPRTTVNVPKALYDAIRDLVEEGKAAEGYVSVDDFIRDTLRERLRQLGQHKITD